jgi:two-component system response regulator MprA
MGDPSLAPPEQIARARKILVVDDDDDLRAALHDVLEDAGYRAHTAADGREALEQLLGGLAPDLILLDLLMPEMDGPALLLRLATNETLSAIPVVAMTASHDRFVRVVPMCAAYVLKPFSPEDLIGVVERVLAPAPAPVNLPT